MRKRHIIFSVVAAICIASGALLVNLPPFTPAGTVEVRALDSE
jgi:hypothetical protein